MAKKTNRESALPVFFGRRNWQWLGTGAVVIVVGFIALSMGSITLAPLLLVAGYCVFIPVGLLVGPKRGSGEAAGSSDH